MIIRFLVLSLFILLFSFPSNAQYEEDYVYPKARNDDYTYRSYIRSVRFYPEDSEVDYPIVELNSPIKLILEFDDLDADNKNYFYKIIHCNYDWTPSQGIDKMDYIDGFQENRFYESTSSFGTRTEYTHYQLKIPNDDISLTKTGNYLLKVYLEDDEQDLVITRRFVVYEPQMKVVPKMRSSAMPPNARSHQEFYFQVEHAGVYISNPATDVNVAVLRNGRWNTAIMDKDPTFVKEETIVFDRQGMFSFRGAREFRPLDIRSFRHRGPQVDKMNITTSDFYLRLYGDNTRKDLPYLFTNDVNGKFIIESHDNPAPHERGEYGKIWFTLHAPYLPNHDVYVMGGFTDFEPHKQYLLSYNETDKNYQGEISMKNGFYDYYYAAVHKETGEVDENILEGSSFETENDYLFLVYYRPFGGRYDQVVAFDKMNTRQN